jgi:GntR family transcriptional regulator
MARATAPVEPLYRSVARRIGDEIAAGTFGPGAKLPSERELCDTLNVSRVTLRRGLADLVAAGRIEASPSRGWFVSARPLSSTSFVSFTGMGAMLGLQASAQVLRCETRPATLDEAEALLVAPGVEIFSLERLRFLDGVAIALDHSRSLLQRAPGLIDASWTTASLYQLLEDEYGIVPTRSSYVVEARAADDAQAELLEITPGSALLVATQKTFDQDNRPIEIGWIAYRADRYRFRAELTRGGIGSGW